MKSYFTKIELITLTIILAFCSIVYELLLSNTLAIVTGSYVWWQSLTVGIFIGGLGLGAFYSEKVTDTYKSLMNVELGLSLLGAICVTHVYIFHAFYKYFDNIIFYTNGDFYSAAYVENLFIAKILFFIIVQAVTLGIGFLSGFEIPLLMKMSDLKFNFTENNEHRILAFNYIGTLVGTMFFAYLFLPKFDVIKTSVVVSGLNLLVCIYFLVKYLKLNRTKYIVAISVVGAIIITIGINQNQITQRYLKFYYYLPKILGKNNVDFNDVLRRVDKLQPIERSKSLYQYVDIFHYPYSDENGVKDATILTLDTNFQFSTATEFYYHEAFSHVPIAINKHVPKKVLVLGGGDGLLNRELLKYKEIESIHHIELDQKMVDLAKGRFSYLNKDSLSDSRVHLDINDGFYYLRNTHDKYDAIFIDFPYPNSYDLAKLYSVEFYKFVLRALNDDGFVVFDAPFYNKTDPTKENNPDHIVQIFNDRHLINNSIFVSTVYFAGFKTIMPYRVADESFLFLKKNPGQANYDFVDQVDTKLFSKATLRDLQDVRTQNFPYLISPKYVNSIFKPTIARKEDF